MGASHFFPFIKLCYNLFICIYLLTILSVTLEQVNGLKTKNEPSNFYTEDFSNTLLQRKKRSLSFFKRKKSSSSPTDSHSASTTSHTINDGHQNDQSSTKYKLSEYIPSFLKLSSSKKIKRPEKPQNSKSDTGRYYSTKNIHPNEENTSPINANLLKTPVKTGISNTYLANDMNLPVEVDTEIKKIVNMYFLSSVDKSKTKDPNLNITQNQYLKQEETAVVKNLTQIYLHNNSQHNMKTIRNLWFDKLVDLAVQNRVITLYYLKGTQDDLLLHQKELITVIQRTILDFDWKNVEHQLKAEYNLNDEIFNMVQDYINSFEIMNQKLDAAASLTEALKKSAHHEATLIFEKTNKTAPSINRITDALNATLIGWAKELRQKVYVKIPNFLPEELKKPREYDPLDNVEKKMIYFSLQLKLNLPIHQRIQALVQHRNKLQSKETGFLNRSNSDPIIAYPAYPSNLLHSKHKSFGDKPVGVGVPYLAYIPQENRSLDTSIGTDYEQLRLHMAEPDFDRSLTNQENNYINIIKKNTIEEINDPFSLIKLSRGPQQTISELLKVFKLRIDSLNAVSTLVDRDVSNLEVCMCNPSSYSTEQEYVFWNNLSKHMHIYSARVDHLKSSVQNLRRLFDFGLNNEFLHAINQAESLTQKAYLEPQLQKDFLEKFKAVFNVKRNISREKKNISDTLKSLIYFTRVFYGRLYQNVHVVRHKRSIEAELQEHRNSIWSFIEADKSSRWLHNARLLINHGDCKDKFEKATQLEPSVFDLLQLVLRELAELDLMNDLFKKTQNLQHKDHQLSRQIIDGILQEKDIITEKLKLLNNEMENLKTKNNITGLDLSLCIALLGELQTANKIFIADFFTNAQVHKNATETYSLHNDTFKDAVQLNNEVDNVSFRDQMADTWPQQLQRFNNDYQSLETRLAAINTGHKTFFNKEKHFGDPVNLFDQFNDMEIQIAKLEKLINSIKLKKDDHSLNYDILWKLKDLLKRIEGYKKEVDKVDTVLKRIEFLLHSPDANTFSREDKDMLVKLIKNLEGVNTDVQNYNLELAQITMPVNYIQAADTNNVHSFFEQIKANIGSLLNQIMSDRLLRLQKIEELLKKRFALKTDAKRALRQWDLDQLYQQINSLLKNHEGGEVRANAIESQLDRVGNQIAQSKYLKNSHDIHKGVSDLLGNLTNVRNAMEATKKDRAIYAELNDLKLPMLKAHIQKLADLQQSPSKSILLTDYLLTDPKDISGRQPCLYDQISQAKTLDNTLFEKKAVERYAEYDNIRNELLKYQQRPGFIDNGTTNLNTYGYTDPVSSKTHAQVSEKQREINGHIDSVNDLMEKQKVFIVERRRRAEEAFKLYNDWNLAKQELRHINSGLANFSEHMFREIVYLDFDCNAYSDPTEARKQVLINEKEAFQKKFMWFLSDEVFQQLFQGTMHPEWIDASNTYKKILEHFNFKILILQKIYSEMTESWKHVERKLAEANEEILKISSLLKLSQRGENSCKIKTLDISQVFKKKKNKN